MTDFSAFSLEGKTVVVTGANTGIGQGIAVAAATVGARVIAVGRSDMADTVAQVAAAGGTAIPVQADLSDPAVAGELLGSLWREHGPLDGLVNNAGIIRRDDAVDHSEADWDDVLAINLKSVFLLSQSFGRQVIEAGRRGKIVNIASLLSFQGGIRVAAYAASKHGVAGLTHALSNEWASKDINVNAVAPGYVVSNNTAALRADADRSASILARIPAARWGQPSDIGSAAVFLLAPGSDYVHGTVIPVDGGWLAR